MTAVDEARLHAAGIRSPRRAVRLMRSAIERLELDLGGQIVVTEAGSGVFALTAVMAAMAGAKVRALARASAWGSVASIRETVEVASRLAGVEVGPEVMESRQAAFAGANIVTNLGFVRPIGREAIQSLSPGAVVALMCEGWEVRPGDLDFDACRDHDVLVLATNEHHPLCNVFRFAGPLAGQMLMEAGFELLDVRVAVVGRDAFAPEIAAWLRAAGASVVMGTTDGRMDLQHLRAADVVFICEYASEALIVGPGGLVDPAELARIAPSATVLQFAGRVDRESILDAGLGCWPGDTVGARRMTRTFGALGPAPVIDLHAGGLKVAEIGARVRPSARNAEEAAARALAASTLVQRVEPRGGAAR